MPPDWSSFARWTRFRSPPDSCADELLLIRAAEVEARHIGTRRDLAGAGLDDLGALGDLLEHGLLPVEVVAGLVDVGHLDRVADVDRPGVGRLLADDHPEERRLAGAIRADDPDDPRPRQRERQVLDQQAVAEALAQAIDLDDLVAEPRPRRDRDLELALDALRVVRLGEELLVSR